MTIGINARGGPPSPQPGLRAALREALLRRFRRAPKPLATYKAPAELLDQAAIGFGLLDDEGRWRAANPTLAAWLGIDLFIEPANGLAAIPLHPAPPAGLGPVAADGGIFTLSAPEDGVDVWVAPLRQELGQPPRFAAVARSRRGANQTAHRRNTAAGPSHEPFGRFFADAPVGIAVVDRSGGFLHTNRALGALFEVDPRDLIGRRLTDWLHPDDREGIVAKLDAAAEHQARAAAEIRLAPPHERTLVMLCRFDAAEPDGNRPEHTDGRDGEEDGQILYFIDVTERKQLEAQFAQSLKMQAVGQWWRTISTIS